MKKIILSLLLLVVVGFTATSVFAYVVSDTTQFEDKKITFLGDSILEGIVLDESDRVSALVGDALGMNAINMGKSGSRISISEVRSDAFVQRMISVPNDSDIIVIMGGYNDFWNDTPLQDIKDAYTTLLNYLIENTDARIINMTYLNTTQGSNDLGASYANLQQAIRDVTSDRVNPASTVAKGRLELIDLYNIMGQLSSQQIADYTYDGVHLSEEGAQLVANILISYLNGDDLSESFEWTEKTYHTNDSIITLDYFSTTTINTLEVGKHYAVYSGLKGSTDSVTGILIAFYNVNDEVIGGVGSSPFTQTVDHMVTVFKVPVNTEYVVINAQTKSIENFFSVRELFTSSDKLHTVNFYNGDTAYKQHRLLVSDGSTLDAVKHFKTPTKENYIFGGWYTSKNLVSTWNIENPVTEDVNFYAKWVNDNSNSGGTPVGGGDATLSNTLTYILIAGVAAAGFYFFFTDKGRKSIGLK